MNDQSDPQQHGAGDAGSTRYGKRSGSGANEPQHREKKEQPPDWMPRQGGDNSSGPGTEPSHDAKENER
ncbi:MAG: hypothetical protein H0U52_08835 [Chloroflexi bacterium]|nr:hypothetical protein [Chloroflexota bacterium]